MNNSFLLCSSEAGPLAGINPFTIVTNEPCEGESHQTYCNVNYIQSKCNMSVAIDLQNLSIK